MSVTVRPFRTGGLQVRINVRLATGRRYEEKKVMRVSKSVAQRWGEQRERYLLVHGLPAPKKEVPTLNEFAPRFMDGYARANRQKPSGIAAKETILRHHLLPAFGGKRLDAITDEAVQQLKHRLADKAPKTVNNVVTVLNVLLKTAVEWKTLAQLPCTIRLLPVPITPAQFHDFPDYDRLAEAAKRLGPTSYLVVLLGGDAGLRLGEIMALEWQDIDFQRQQICVQQSEWKGEVTTPKGGRLRYVPMTSRLSAALQTHRHLAGPRVLVREGGRPLTMKIIQNHAAEAAKAAGVKHGVHILRHTFCSHLAMGGVPARAIQELAGHRDLRTTQRYMHLSPAAIDGAIGRLDSARLEARRGNSVETSQSETGKSLYCNT